MLNVDDMNRMEEDKNRTSEIPVGETEEEIIEFPGELEEDTEDDDELLGDEDLDEVILEDEMRPVFTGEEEEPIEENLLANGTGCGFRGFGGCGIGYGGCGIGYGGCGLGYRGCGLGFGGCGVRRCGPWGGCGLGYGGCCRRYIW